MRRTIRALRWVLSWRRTAAIMLFLAFSAVLTTGVVRLVQYDLPMRSGDYVTASTPNILFTRGMNEDDPNLPLGDNPSVGDRAINGMVDSWYRYCDWAVGERAKPLFNLARQQYFKEQRYGEARKTFSRALQAMCDQDKTTLLPQYRELVSHIHVFIGLTYEHEDKSEEAYPWYENALSPPFNPHNMVGKYNLERLQDSKSGGGGPSQNDQKPQPTPGKIKPKI